MISDACPPQIEPDISIQTLEDKTVLAIDIVPGKFRPYYLATVGKESSTYIRINGTSRPADTRKIQCALFKGNTRDIFIDRKEFNGPLYEQVDDAYHFVLRHIDMGAEIEGVYRFHHQGFFMVVWILKLPNPENRHAETRRLLKHFIICILLRHGEQDFQEL